MKGTKNYKKAQDRLEKTLTTRRFAKNLEIYQKIRSKLPLHQRKIYEHYFVGALSANLDYAITNPWYKAIKTAYKGSREE